MERTFVPWPDEPGILGRETPLRRAHSADFRSAPGPNMLVAQHRTRARFVPCHMTALCRYATPDSRASTRALVSRCRATTTACPSTRERRCGPSIGRQVGRDVTFE